MTAMNNEEETGPDMLKRPRMRLPDDRARMLIEAAVGEFLANGFRRGSVENIARVTGIGKATISPTRTACSRPRCCIFSTGWRSRPSISPAGPSRRRPC